MTAVALFAFIMFSSSYKKNKKNEQVWPKPHTCRFIIPPT
jgi:hypothetical protein